MGHTRSALVIVLALAFAGSSSAVPAAKGHRRASPVGARPARGRAPHPFQQWLHSQLGRLGDRVSASRLGATGVSRPYASLRSGGTFPFASADSVVIGDGDEDWDGDMKPVDISDNIFMDEGTFQRGSQAWMSQHRETLQADMMWICAGICVGIVATCTLVVSEVRAVLAQRKVDDLVLARKEVPSELVADVRAEYGRRTWLSLASVAAMVVALWLALFALCHMATAMLASMHYEFTGCYRLAFLVAWVVAAVWALFVAGCCWICARPWTAVLCLGISFCGGLALDTGLAAAVSMWAVVSAGGAYIFFVYGHHFVSEGPGKRRASAPPLRDR